jgi:transposase
MTYTNSTGKGRFLIAIDVSKAKHDVLVELPTGQLKRMVVRNCKTDFEQFAAFLSSIGQPPTIAFEPTTDYHRGFAYFLKKKGFNVCSVSSVAVSRTREALHNSRDKNDAKDAAIILHLLRTDVTQTYFDPVFERANDLKELSLRYAQISKRTTKVQNSLKNHYLALYFPEADELPSKGRSGRYSRLLLHFPIPESICRLPEHEFIAQGSRLLGSRKLKQDFLGGLYVKASQSVGIDVSPSSLAIDCFRQMLEDHIRLCEQRKQLEKTAVRLLKNNSDYKLLTSIPGIGPVIALTILGEAGDLRRFGNVRQFLKFCGFDLSTYQSGALRGKSHISKRGNTRLRRAYWLAATVAVGMKDNSFQAKFARLTRSQRNSDEQRKAFTAAAAKMARVTFGVIKHQTLYRAFHEAAVPGGMNPFISSVEAGSNSVTS